MKLQQDTFLLCIDPGDNEDLERGKVYHCLPDSAAAEEDYVRVEDESGDDYLYPRSCFVAVALPEEARDALLATA